MTLKQIWEHLPPWATYILTWLGSLTTIGLVLVLALSFVLLGRLYVDVFLEELAERVSWAWVHDAYERRYGCRPASRRYR